MKLLIVILAMLLTTTARCQTKLGEHLHTYQPINDSSYWANVTDTIRNVSCVVEMINGGYLRASNTKYLIHTYQELRYGTLKIFYTIPGASNQRRLNKWYNDRQRRLLPTYYYLDEDSIITVVFIDIHKPITR